MTGAGSDLRVALIGCGQIADAHLQEVGRIPGASVVAVCDRDVDLAYQAAVRFGVPRHFTDADEMFDRVRPDVIHLTTPPQSHAPLAVQALRRGCHVYVEKPFTVTPDEARFVLNTAADEGRLVCVGLDQLWEPVWRQVQDLNARGVLGDIVHVDSHQGYALDGPYGRLLQRSPDHWVHKLPGGVFQNVMPHALAKITDLIPGDPDAVQAFAFSRASAGAFPTELRASMRWPRQSANLVFCSAGRPLQRLARIVGTAAMVDVDFDARVVRRLPRATWPGAFGRIQLSLNHWRASSRDVRTVIRQFRKREIHYFGGMRALFADFYHAIRNGLSAPISAERILHETVLMDRIFRLSMPEAVEPLVGAVR